MLNKFYKPTEAFARDLRLHVQAVETVKRLLGARVESHADVSDLVRVEGKKFYHADFVFQDEIVKVVGTVSDKIYITPRLLNTLAMQDAVIFYVFLKKSGVIREIRRVKAVQLKAYERRALTGQNKYRHPVLIYPREIAEEVFQR